MNSKFKWYVVLLFGLAVLLAAFITACAGEEEATPTATKAAPTATAPAAAPTPTATAPAAAPTPTATVPAAEPTPTQPVAGGPPNIPAGHATAGCPTCHKDGLAGAPKWPDNHASYTDQVCGTCHKPAGG